MRGLLSILAALLAVTLSPSVSAEEAPKEPAFTVTTSSFLEEGMLPVLYTCDGKDVPPAMEWSNTPDKTQTFAVIFLDNDAPNPPFYHWVVYNIPKSVTKLDEATQKLPAGAMVGKNSYAKTQYNGPCPPKGGSHNYTFTLYALDTKLNLPAGADAKAVVDAMQNHIVGKDELVAVYSRWFQ